MKLKLTLLLIGFLFIATANQVLAQRQYAFYNTKTGQKLTPKQLATELSKQYDVVFFGEFHDDSLIHILESQLLENLLLLKKKTAVSMEMFERDVQPAVNDYLSGKSSEKDFLANSRPWENYPDAYKPIIEQAKTKKIAVIAANVPRKYAALYSSGGLKAINNLPPTERIFLAKSINPADDAYQIAFYKQMMDNFGLGDDYTKLSLNQQNTLALYYGAQVVKDETMAESIYEYWVKNKKSLVIHYNGDFHSRSRMGTAQKLNDRDKSIRIAIISPDYSDNGLDFKPELKILGDYVLILDPKPANDMGGPEMMGGHLGMNFIEQHNISLELDPATHSLKAKDLLKFKNPVIKKASFSYLKDLNIASLTSPDGLLTYEIKASQTDSTSNDLIITAAAGNEITNLEITYSGIVNHQPNIRQFNQRHAYSSGIISDLPGEGIYLPAGSFYPYTSQDMSDFNVQVTFPEQLEILTSGLLTKQPAVNGKKTYTFKSEIKYDNLTMVGGRYFVQDTIYDGKNFAVYTFEKTALAKTYMNACIEYYKIYTVLFGPYPFSSFDVVENFFATGFGMPNYTLLSNQLMKMPWVTLTPGALAHEFVHNWWGNSVFVNPDRENWCEGLTTFSANYFYNVINGNDQKAFEWRQSALVSLESLPASLNYPLKKFKYQETDEDAVIGYQKGGFLFYEMYKLMGKENFFGALKNFAKSYKGKRATWFSLSFSMQKYAEKNNLDIPVNMVFNQWLNASRIPVIKIGDVTLNGDSCYFNILQDTAFYMSVPVRIITAKDTFWKNCLITELSNRFSVSAKNNIKSIEVDPLYQSLRKMYKWEIPFTMKQTQNANPVFVLPPKKSPDFLAALEYVGQMNKTGYNWSWVNGDEIKDKDFLNKSLIIIGTPKTNPLIAKLATSYPAGFQIVNEQFVFKGKTIPLKGNLAMINYSPKGNPAVFYTYLYCDNMKSVEQFRRFSHYSSYSVIIVPPGRGGQPFLMDHLYPEKPSINELKFSFGK